MKTYTVTLRTTVERVIEVDASNEDEAIELASNQFKLKTGPGDKCTEEVVDWEEVTGYRRAA